MSFAATLPNPGIAWRLSRYRGLWLGLMTLTAVLVFGRIGDRALWSMEVRWGQIPREMQRHGDYFTPTINGHLYYDKPLGSYWLVLAASAFAGGIDETTARLPSALAGLLAVAMLVRIARPLFGDRTALLAGLILATSFSFVGFARTASADMETVAGELLALLLYLEGGRRPASWRIFALWLVMALTSLTKGLLGFALPLLVIGIHASLQEADGCGWVRRFAERHRWFFHRATPLAMLLAVAVYFTPFALAADGGIADRGLYMVFRENLQRFFNPVNHRGPVYLYAYVIFGLFAPWSVLLPSALTYRGTEAKRARTFAAAFFWATFLFFTLSASRRSYYLLPLLPAAALLVARLLTAESASRLPRILLKIGFAVVTVAVVGLGMALLPRHWLPGPSDQLPPAPAWPVVVAGWVAAIFGVTAVWRRFDSRRVAVALGGVAAGAMAYLYLIAIPATEDWRWQRSFAAEVRRETGSEPLALYRTRELVYYLDAPADLAEFESEADLRSAVDTGRVRWLILREVDLPRLTLPSHVVVRAGGFTWDQATNRTLLVRCETAGR
ncbi:MAG: ArnT family glycosyltransferase [Gemmataceae bacterium]